MKLVVGLGNPGKKYENNRHNVGHHFINYVLDKLEQYSSSEAPRSREVKFVKTDCYMNLSGSFVKKLISNQQLVIDNLVIIHDDLDIPLGKFKIQKGSGPELHNGINSIEKALGTKDFWRVRIGVENRTSDNRIPGDVYVLRDFTAEEKEIIDQTFPQIFERLKELLTN